MRDFIILINNISYCIKNIQVQIVLLHEFGVKQNVKNEKYSSVKTFEKDSHSYINSMKPKYIKNFKRVVPNIIPETTVSDLYFYLYNTSLRQQLNYFCFYDKNNIYKEENGFVYYDADNLGECYKNIHVIFRLIMNEYEKTILWHCINYTMNKLHIDNNLSAILCHDGYMLDRKYFDNGPLKYDTYLCDIKEYIQKTTGLNINFEYKGHCDEVIPDNEINCVQLPVENYSCKDYTHVRNNNNKKIRPRTTNDIKNLTSRYIETNNPVNKLYYDGKRYYHIKSERPEKIESDENKIFPKHIIEIQTLDQLNYLLENNF